MQNVTRRHFVSLAAAFINVGSIRSGRPPIPELRLETRLERIGDSLALHYRVQSDTNRDAYLLNRVSDQSLQTNPDLIYIELDRSARLVRAYKKIPDLPSGMSPTMPMAPYVTPLRAGKHFEEVVHIPLPVHEFRAYSAAPQHGHQVRYVGLTFTIGYYWSLPGMKEHTQQIIPGVEVLIPTPPPRSNIEFGQLTSAVMQMDLEVVET